MWFKSDDRFAPRMPDVNLGADISEVFAKARSQLALERPAPEAKAGQRCLAIVTPDRKLYMLGGLPPGTVPDGFAARAKFWLPSNRPLNITALGFPGLRTPKPRDLLRLPFVAAILSFVYIGHSVVMFEGHGSGLEAALQGADVLLVDSGMLPFLQRDWFEVSRRVSGKKGRVLVFEQKAVKWLPLVPTNPSPGWEFATEHDGETSYVNALLTTLGKRSPLSITLDPTQPLPDLTTLATDPDEVDWTSKLPFQYDMLDVDEVIRVIVNTPKMNWSPSQDQNATATVKAEVLQSGGPSIPVTFRFLLITAASGKRSLQIERLA